MSSLFSAASGLISATVDVVKSNFSSRSTSKSEVDAWAALNEPTEYLARIVSGAVSAAFSFKQIVN